MKYFDYKRLNKRRKFYFWLSLICGTVILVSGIISKNIWEGVFGFVLFIECLDVLNDQATENIINNYCEYIKETNKLTEKNFKIISQVIKSKDSKQLEEIVKQIDSFYKEEQINDSESR